MNVIIKLANNHALAETGRDDAKKGDQMEKLQKGEDVDVDLADPEVQAAATKIQASFRGHKAREDVKKHKDEEAAAVKIQACFRGHKAREKVKAIKLTQSQELVVEDTKATEADMVGEASEAQAEEAVAEEVGHAVESKKQEDAADVQPAEAEVTEEEAKPKEPDVTKDDVAEDQDSTEAKEKTVDAVDEGEAGDTQAEEERAAASGEAAEEAQPDGTEGGEVEGEAEEVDLDINDPELHSAAVKIQASFRGHKAREEVKALQSSESLPQEGGEVPAEEKTEDDAQNVTEVDEEKDGDVQESATGAELPVAEETEESKPSED